MLKLISNINFQDEEKSLLLNILFLVVCTLLTIYPQKALPDIVKVYSSEEDTAFPSILFGEIPEIDEGVDSTDPSDSANRFLNLPLSLPSNKPLKTYGPVGNNESLWNIADQLRSDESIKIAQMAVALFKQNPKAFLNNNINGLLVGVLLHVPDENQVNQFSKRETEILFQQHWLSWKKNTDSSAKADRESANDKEAVQADEAVEKPSSKVVYANAVDIVPVKDVPILDVAPVKDISAVDTKPQFAQHETVIAVSNKATQTTEKKAESKVIATFNQTDTNENSQFVDSNKSSEFVLLDYFSQIKFQSVFNDIWHNISKSINLFWLDIKANLWSISEHDSLVSLRARILLIVFFVFLVLVYFFRRQEIDFTDVQPHKYQAAHLPLLEPVVEKETSADQETAVINAPLNKKITAQDSFSNESSRSIKSNNDEYRVAVDIVQDDELYWENNSNVFEGISETIDTSVNAVANQVNINKFLNPNQPSQQSNRIGLLEKAFDMETFITAAECPQEKVKEENVQVKEQAYEDVSTSNLLDSVEEIKYVHETTRVSRMDAFCQATQLQKEPSEKSRMDEMLAIEFSKIKDHDKIDVFIEEFEQLLRTLAQQAPVLENRPNELEYLIQFKISIHFIKVLSEMMQANYLQHFSQIVIEFLEDLVDGKSRMTVDVASRLSIVIGFYDQYINSVKNNQMHKVKV
ncbi:MAG: FimV/HubP family polar landmark protein [Gammaproteobacteria bacterium]|nr:FimV/HubP family polar landmark protein [Gammaproteobacteria bacterium]